MLAWSWPTYPFRLSRLLLWFYLQRFFPMLPTSHVWMIRKCLLPWPILDIALSSVASPPSSFSQVPLSSSVCPWSQCTHHHLPSPCICSTVCLVDSSLLRTLLLWCPCPPPRSLSICGSSWLTFRCGRHLTPLSCPEVSSAVLLVTCWVVLLTLLWSVGTSSITTSRSPEPISSPSSWVKPYWAFLNIQCLA